MVRASLLALALLAAGCNDGGPIPPEGYSHVFPTNSVFFDIQWDDGGEGWFDSMGLALVADVDGERSWTTDIGPCTEVKLQPTGMRELGESWLVELTGSSLPHTCTWVSRGAELTATVNRIDAEWTPRTFELHLRGRLTAVSDTTRNGTITAEFYGSAY